MRMNRPCVIALLFALAVPVATAFGGQRARQSPTPSQQQILDRIAQLKAEIDELLAQLPEDMRSEVRRSLAEPSPPARVVAVAPLPVEVALPNPLFAPGSRQVIILDLAGNGIDLGGQVVVEVGGQPQRIAWTRDSADDAFLLIRATSLRRAGYELFSGRGESIDGEVLLSDGVRVRTPAGSEIVIRDAWHLLAVLDVDNDGRFTGSDSSWQHVGLFVDGNGNARVDAGEVMSLADGGLAGLSLGAGGARNDRYGNVLSEGTYTRSDGRVGLAAGVTLRR